MRRYRDFKPAGGRIEFPARLLTGERDRKREVVGSHDQKSLFAFDDHIVLGVVGSHEPLPGFAIRHLVAGEHDVHGIPAEHLEDISRCAGFDGGGERRGGILRRLEGLLSVGERYPKQQRGCCQETGNVLATALCQSKLRHRHILARIGIRAPAASQSL